MMIVIALLLLAVAVLLWLIYSTTDSFNQDLKQLRLLANQIEKHLADMNPKSGDTPDRKNTDEKEKP